MKPFVSGYDYEVIIVGAGISGLSTALILGRCRRNVLVLDDGKPRNWAAKALHGFLTRDGTFPMEMRTIGREQIENTYRTVEFLDKSAVNVRTRVRGYEIEVETGARFSAPFLVLATGVVDILPDVEGMLDFYGSGVFHCPYCDGWENRDKPLAVYGRGKTGFDYALELKTWSSDVLLCVDGEPLPRDLVQRLSIHGVKYSPEKIKRLVGKDGFLTGITFVSGDWAPVEALFFRPDQYQRSPLAEKLGLEPKDGVVPSGKYQAVKPGLFVVGDADKSVQLAIVAAAEGAEAAFAINTELQEWENEEREKAAASE